MQTGEIRANIVALNQCFGIKEIDELVARKRAGAEKMLLDEHDLANHGPVLDRLESSLVDAHEKSALPNEATTIAALDDFVVRLRLGMEQRDDP